MREELMVKGDTTNKTSSGKLSLMGRIKGQGERPRLGEAGARHRVVAALLGFVASESPCHSKAQLRVLLQLRKPHRGFSLALKVCSGLG